LGIVRLHSILAPFHNIPSFSKEIYPSFSAVQRQTVEWHPVRVSLEGLINLCDEIDGEKIVSAAEALEPLPKRKSID
jgi:hypothetical protein